MTRLSWFGMALVFSNLIVAQGAPGEIFFIRAMAQDKFERTRIADAGFAIDGVLSDSVTIFGTEKDVQKLKSLGISVEVNSMENAEDSRAFPTADRAFHDYAQTLQELDKLHTANPNLVTRISIGKSLEGRDLSGVRISSAPLIDSLPTAIFLGCHHAREHLSVEVPLKLAQYLVANYATNPRIKNLLDTREVWIVPMVNPDGAEYDISGNRYRYWRKNRSRNFDGTAGVDLNRNYGSHWGGQGASASTSDETYRGPSAFSEPETQSVRDFVRARKHATTLLTFHSFSELVLWPWGYAYDVISNTADRTAFETMGRKMASWNHYKAEKSSDLYLASGDTTDWAYDELKIFAYTIELTPTSMFAGGFYPGAKAIEPTFQANLEPSLYLIEQSANPYGALAESMDPLGLVD